jgi:hypothetical protein
LYWPVVEPQELENGLPLPLEPFPAVTVLPPEVQALPLRDMVSSGPPFTVVGADGTEAIADTFT